MPLASIPDTKTASKQRNVGRRICPRIQLCGWGYGAFWELWLPWPRVKRTYLWKLFRTATRPPPCWREWTVLSAEPTCKSPFSKKWRTFSEASEWHLLLQNIMVTRKASGQVLSSENGINLSFFFFKDQQRYCHREECPRWSPSLVSLPFGVF